jgi:DUF4097 and DUF4098 domain-containing protein YvlB
MHIFASRSSLDSRIAASLLTLLLLAASVHPALAQRAERNVSDTVAMDADGTVYIDNHDGAITVTPWDRNEVQYEARITHRRQEGVDNTKIRVDASSASVSLDTDFDDIPRDGMWGGRSAPKVFYTLNVPTSASIVIDDHESTIDIRDLTGDVEIDTHDGSMTLTNLSGDVEIDTHDGSMELADLTGEVEIDTHDSDLRATGLTGPLEIDTHDGDIEVEFASLNGPITIDSHDARATITLPAGTGFNLAADMGEDASIDVQPSVSVSSMNGGGMQGAANGGGPEIRVSSHDGDLQIRERG